MSVRVRLLCLLAYPALAASMGIARAETPLTTVRVAQGLSMPLYVTAPPGDTTRLFIVEQRGADNRGRIKILRNGSVLLRPFLTTDVLAGGSEQGLLGLAFAPDYATTGRFYINYTRADGTTIVARHTVSADPDSAIPAGTVILSIAQPFANHNGGWLGFGPDGFLYISSGDGGSGGDPGDRAQNLSTLLGKILRIDVSGASYTIPSDNPFQGATPGLDEIWAYGLRNPWRCAFDRETGDLVIADVGQSQREEVNFQPASSGGGENYGWRCYEGTLFFSESANIPCGSCLASGCPKIFPLHEYPHSLGRCSITGGYIYRGCAVPDLRGTYFFADYCAGTIYSGRFQGGTFVGLRDRTAGLAPGGGLAIGLITSFGEDARGELYICDQGGEVFKVVPKSPVLEADMPTLRERTALGDSLGSTAPGNALLTGIVPFASTGSRIRGVGYLKDAVIRGCAVISGKCLTSRVRLDPFDIDLDACVDSAANTVTRRFVFTNTAPGPRALAYVDVITPRLRGDPDGATTTAPAGSGSSAVLVQYDSFAPDRWIVHSGSGSTGVTYSADVDTASQLTARVGADQPLAGGSSAGPAEVGLALGFDFGSLAPAARETVVVVTTLQASAPSAVATETASIPNIQLRVLGRIPFRSALQIEIGLARAQRVSLDLFDLAGRRVRAVARWVLPAGKRVVRWDGKLDGGADAPSGVYFIRLATETAVATRRVVLVR